MKTSKAKKMSNTSSLSSVNLSEITNDEKVTSIEPIKGKKRKLAVIESEGGGGGSKSKKGTNNSKHTDVSKDTSAVSVADVDNSMNLGSLLMTLFELFGWNLNMRTTGISVRGKTGGGYYSKENRGWFNPMRPALLSLENPCEPETDVGKNSWGIDKVRRALRTAHASLSCAVRSWIKDGSNGGTKMRSLLSTIIVPDQLLADREAEILSQVSKISHHLAVSSTTLLSSASTESGLANASSESAKSLLSVALSSVHPTTEGPPGVDIEEGETEDIPAPPPKSKRFKPTKDEELNTSSTAKQGVAVKSLDIVGTASVLGRTLRHGRLMADLMTRKERNVEELNAAPQGFY